MGKGFGIPAGQPALYRLAPLQGDGHGDAGVPGRYSLRRRAGREAVFLAPGGAEPVPGQANTVGELERSGDGEDGDGRRPLQADGHWWPWAQDPPYYAGVVAFETGPERDWAHIRLAGGAGSTTGGFTSTTTVARL